MTPSSDRDPARSVYRRQITLRPTPGAVHAQMADHHHHFICELDLAGDRIGAVRVQSVRSPWVTCQVGAEAASALIGLTLDEADDPRSWALDRSAHCTHVADLALLAVRHARDAETTVIAIDIRPAAGTRRVATLSRNDAEAMRWELEGSVIVGPAPFDHLSLDRHEFLPWIRTTLDAQGVEHAMILRRASTLAFGNAFDLDAYPLASDVHPADDTCYTYRREVAMTAPRRVGTSRPLVWE